MPPSFVWRAGRKLSSRATARVRSTAAGGRLQGARIRYYSTPSRVSNFIGGQAQASSTSEWTNVLNPATQELVCAVPHSTVEEMEAAVAAAETAFKTWRHVPVQQRQRIMLKLQRLVRESTPELAQRITIENGKTLEDARGDVFRGLEVVEAACGVAPSLMGETLGGLAQHLDTVSFRQPLGVTAGICPFNFPAMIPMWMFPLAIVAGNTMVLKPSEKVPGAMMMLAELTVKAGLPPGVLNVIHGENRTVDFLCDAKEVKAISFVGSNSAGEHIFDRATRTGKRVQANLGAKNHAVIMPDADREATVKALVGAAFGAAGQRCMALSVAVFVGEAEGMMDDLVAAAQGLRVGGGMDPNTDVGPLISEAAVGRVERLITQGVHAGAKLCLDGRRTKVDDYPQGNFVGPTILSGIDALNPAYSNEVFGPVLCCVTVRSLDEALAFVNKNEYGNGTAIFTSSGAAARKYQMEVEAGQVGVNVPIPVPLPHFSFTGNKASRRGDSCFYGKEGVKFYTQTKTVTSLWRWGESGGGSESGSGGSSGAPSMHFNTS